MNDISTGERLLIILDIVASNTECISCGSRRWGERLVKR
jgi:hypothetical protein